jgi:hypothetical protein
LTSRFFSPPTGDPMSGKVALLHGPGESSCLELPMLAGIPVSYQARLGAEAPHYCPAPSLQAALRNLSSEPQPEPSRWNHLVSCSSASAWLRQPRSPSSTWGAAALPGWPSSCPAQGRLAAIN